MQPLLFGPQGQDPQQVRQQYAQLTKAYDQHQPHGDITAQATTSLPRAISALGAG